MATFTDSNTGKFDTCKSKIQKFVLDEYLKAKIANFLGIKEDNIQDNTNIQVNFPYDNAEGVIKGYDKNMSLRIDLQKSQAHNNLNYATWQVQWGTGMKDKGGAFAGVLMRTGVTFTFAEFKEAMTKSFGYKHYCFLDP